MCVNQTYTHRDIEKQTHHIYIEHTCLDLNKCLYKYSCKGVGLQNTTLSTTYKNELYTQITYVCTYIQAHYGTFIW